MPILFLFFLSAVFLIGIGAVNTVNSAFRRWGDPYLKFSQTHSSYRRLCHFFFPKNDDEGLLCGLLAALTLLRFFFVFTALIFLLNTELFQKKPHFALYDFSLLWAALSILGSIFIFFVFGEYLPRVLGTRFPKPAIKVCLPIASFFMILTFPITYFIMKFSLPQLRLLSEPLMQTKKEILEMLQRAELASEFNLHEKKLIESVLHFKDRIAREVMVPRVDVISLSADTSIKKAAQLIEEEGFSRVPIYCTTVDNIVGVLMYKDILHQFMKYERQGNDPSILEAPIESIQKNVLYTPETKKISNLLLEFRKKQVHLAIVVDEYGGTEGIVTIEDILEEIVGEIEDEYDEEEELFYPQQDGSWIVDGRLSILDTEQQLGIKIPQEGDYDTIGGYIFHCTGSIPSKGFTIHKEEFQLEILSSDERRVEKVRIKPVIKMEEEEENPPETKKNGKDTS